MEPDIASVAALIGEPARATMLLALLDGRALPAGELAFSACVAPQTASSHLAKLVSARLLQVENQGRHRYYRIANPRVGHAIEALGEIAPPPRVPTHRSEEWKTLRRARTCYNHLAGQCAIEIYAAFETRNFLHRVSGRSCRLTGQGRKWFEELGLDPAHDGRLCIDWTERRYHLGGPLGAALLCGLCDRRWAVRMNKTRAVRLTVTGRTELNKRLGVSI
ncbi:MAG TPA: helix-turn-helix transcriptional regulator [Bryobacteraceae bacterium]|nr:helix-turn-helix transcriptional regulator [Bryobacteraceae bacterium]